MSKLKKLIAAVGLCAAALSSALPAATSSVSAQAAPQPRPSAAATKSAAVSAATAEVLRETSEIRRLAVLRPVRSGAQSRAEIERMLLRNLEENSKPEETRASELALKKFGLLPADFQLRPFLISVLTEQILGYYEPKTQTFYLADWIELEGQQPVMAHELVHALQDQHFDLRRLRNWPRGDADAQVAARALVEGDATLAMIEYVRRDLRRAAAMLKSAGAAQNSKINSAPRVLRESLVFPYERGLGFAQQLHRRGGWEAVSKAFADLPRSTEQILHPEKYFAREAPVKVSLPDLSRTLGRGWRRIDADVNGEWGYYLVLDEFLRDAESSFKAAAGWGGDRYALYENAETRETFLAQLTAWDTDADAREFFDAYARRTTLRYKRPPLADVPDEASRSARRAWQTTEGAVVVERRGARVLILEGVPGKTDVERLLEAGWQPGSLSRPARL